MNSNGTLKRSVGRFYYKKFQHQVFDGCNLKGLDEQLFTFKILGRLTLRHRRHDSLYKVCLKDLLILCVIVTSW